MAVEETSELAVLLDRSSSLNESPQPNNGTYTEVTPAMAPAPAQAPVPCTAAEVQQLTATSLLPEVTVQASRANAAHWKRRAAVLAVINANINDTMEPPRPKKHQSDSQLYRIQQGTKRLPSAVCFSTSPSASPTTEDPTSSQLSVWRDDLCQLCEATAVASDRRPRQQDHERQSQSQLSAAADEEPPAPTRRLPCSCRDRRLHVTCLEVKFQEEASYVAWGRRRQLIMSCAACGETFCVTRRRGRRVCDAGARTSFARHLLIVTVLAGALIGFGLWSMLHPSGGKVNIVNGALIGGGTIVTLLFISYELWLLHRRFDYNFQRLGGRSRHGRDKTARKSSESAGPSSNPSSPPISSA